MALVDRVKNILLQPKTEWPVIEKEFTDSATVYTTYVLPLAAIGPICAAIGWSLLGMSAPFIGTVRLSLGQSFAQAVVMYVTELLAVFVLALIIDALAPSFGGEKNPVQALKLAAYAKTASWVGGVFFLIPPLSLLALVCALYGLYLIYLGLPVMMKSPADKALPYTVVMILVGIVLGIVFAAIRTALLPSTFHLGGLR